jgi:hypothetical protein
VLTAKDEPDKGQEGGKARDNEENGSQQRLIPGWRRAPAWIDARRASDAPDIALHQRGVPNPLDTYPNGQYHEHTVQRAHEPVLQDAVVKRKRPFGVTVIALLMAVSAPTTGLSVLFSPVHFVFGRLMLPVHGHLTFPAANATLVLDLESSIITIIGLVIAVGLWRLKHWAWLATMLWTGTVLASALWLYVQGHPAYLVMIQHIVIVFYLNQSDVQNVFAKGPVTRQRDLGSV